VHLQPQLLALYILKQTLPSSHCDVAVPVLMRLSLLLLVLDSRNRSMNVCLLCLLHVCHAPEMMGANSAVTVGRLAGFMRSMQSSLADHKQSLHKQHCLTCCVRFERSKSIVRWLTAQTVVQCVESRSMRGMKRIAADAAGKFGDKQPTQQPSPDMDSKIPASDDTAHGHSTVTAHNGQTRV
jgi:hypothetical protein